MLYLGFVTALYAIFLQLLYLRKLPICLMRFHFLLHIVLQVIVCWIVCRIISLLSETFKWYDLRKSESLCRRACSVIFKYIPPFPNLHIRVEYMTGSMRFSDIKFQHCMCLTHASFFDVILFLLLAPTSYISHSKTFNKASLWNLPLFGYVIKACGHFPVYFLHEGRDSFKVDKQKQAQVAASVDKFLQEGGSLAFFPEGALNRTPEQLISLRAGGFNTVLTHNLSLYYFISYGNHEVWPSKLKGAPGYPADIYVYVGKYEYDPNVDAHCLASAVREEMQKHLDDMIALRNKRAYKPWSEVSSVKPLSTSSN